MVPEFRMYVQNTKKLNLKCFPANHCIYVYRNLLNLMIWIYKDTSHSAHIYCINNKILFCNNWHLYETETDVNSAWICCLISKYFTRWNSTWDLHLKLWSNEHGLYGIIPWFYPQRRDFFLSPVACNTPRVPRWEHRPVFLPCSL